MSAKEFYYHRPRFHIRALPDEIILEAMRHATWVPYGIAPTDLVVKRLQSSAVTALEKEYRQSLVTKTYLIRVCKQWHRLAYLFLYEWILLSRIKDLPALIVAVEQLSTARVGKREPHPMVGWGTRRLDIDFQLTGYERESDVQDLGCLLLRLLRNLINLEVLTVGQNLGFTGRLSYDAVNEGNFYWLSPAISHSWGSRLRFLNWLHEPDTLDEKIWEQFVRSHPHIVGINPSATFWSNPTPDFSHNLLTWTTGFCTPVPISDSTFPSLRRLSINLHTMYIVNPGWRDDFIQSPLTSLTVLQLNFVHFFGGPGIDLNISLQLIHPIIHEFMPCLRRVEFVLPEWPAMWSGYVFPATVREFGIRVCSKKPHRTLARFLLQKLNQIVNCALGPLTIQFLDHATLEGILTHEQYLVHHAKECNILKRWLDCEGYEYELYFEEE